MSSPCEFDEKIRLDKWLWAARFYKTRAVAKSAIESGKIRVNGQRPKPGREVRVGDQVVIRQGLEEKTVDILKTESQRKGAPEAGQLYRESSESVAKREQQAADRKTLGTDRSARKPDKKQRRDIKRLRTFD